MEHDTYTLPAFWASYLINHDATGMDASERAAVDEWREENNAGVCVDHSVEPIFCARHDAREVVPFGCECLTFTFERI